MKNFPHQMNKVPRLVQALGVFRDLIEQGKDIEDDGVVGDALTQAAVYSFRRQDQPISELLAVEHEKPRGQQGTRTCARDLRRFFHLLGFITSVKSLNRSAIRLVELSDKPLSFEARAIWSTSLDRMEVTDASGTSHPYRILLRLVSEHDGIPGLFLGLCLEAKDDSEAEFERISQLCTQSDPMAAYRQVGASKHMALNSLKILPAIARQLGDIIGAKDGHYLGQPSLSTTEDEPLEATASRATRGRRPYDPDRRREQQPQHDQLEIRKSFRFYDPDLAAERYTAHEECLRHFSMLVANEFEQYEDLYDLLIVADEWALLVEVKTIRKDEVRQIRLALGQLLYYEHMLVDPMYPDHDIDRLLITDVRPHADLVALLERYHIGTAWLPPDEQLGRSPLADGILKTLGISFGDG